MVEILPYNQFGCVRLTYSRFCSVLTISGRRIRGIKHSYKAKEDIKRRCSPHHVVHLLMKDSKKVQQQQTRQRPLPRHGQRPLVKNGGKSAAN